MNFFKRGMIIDYFKRLGNLDVDIDKLMRSRAIIIIENRIKISKKISKQDT